MSRKQLLFDVYMQTLQEITPQRLITKQCRLENEMLHINGTVYDLSRYKRIVLLGSGKAVIPMAEAVQELLGDKIIETLLVGPYTYTPQSPNTRYIKSSHPLPSPSSIEAAEALMKSLRELESDDLFIYLLSGGNSALVEYPQEGITLEDYKAATSEMLRSGMPIKTMNSVRKHISKVKGGMLASMTQAEGIVLVLSDVIGDDLHAIGSGPFYCDRSTFADAVDSLHEYAIFEKIPKAVQRYLIDGVEGIHPETPKSPHKHITHHILGSNSEVMRIAEQLLKSQGIVTCKVDTPMQGDTETVLKTLLKLLKDRSQQSYCYILGGESTVKVTGIGRGGRNQHLALALLNTLDKEEKEITFLSASTDGIDGNSGAAGALIDSHSRIQAMNHHLDPQHYLREFDSNTFFTATDELLTPGPTHNNLLDIVLMLVENPKYRRDDG